ncbi:MAG: hypothetical protein WA414_11085 [Acidobacteriaceae bacterium]|jgi:hypothetical protein
MLAILCIALVLFTGILQVTHSHPNGHIDPDCSLCMTAHHAAQVVVVVTAEVSVQPVARVVAEKFSPLPRQRFVLKLAIRPPPVPAAIA